MRHLLFRLVLLASFGALAACAAKEESVPSPAAPAPQAKAAWEEEWEQVLAAARKEGRVAVNGPIGGEVRRALTEPFERKYGIKVEFLGALGPTFVPRLRVEREAGQYLWDVYVGGTTSLLTVLKPMGALDPIELALILPEVKDAKNWRGGKLPVRDKDRLALGMTGYVTDAFYVNTTLVNPEQFKSYKDLLDPKWREKILMYDPRIPGAAAGKFEFLYAHKDLGPDFIRALAAQKPLIMRDHPELLRWLAEGRRSIALGTSGQYAVEMIRAGAPIKPVDPRQLREGGSIHTGTGGLALFNRAPHPNAARVYINWLLSKEGATEYSRAAGYASNRLDVPTDHLNPWELPIEGYMTLDDEESTHRRANVVIPFLKKVFGE